MITSLSKLTMSQYIDLVCGDVSVLLSQDETVAPDVLQETRRKLMYDYARLSNEAGAKSYLAERGRLCRYDIELLLFRVLKNLIALGAHEDARKVLRQYGLAREMSDAQTEQEVGRLLKRAESNIRRSAEASSPHTAELTPEEVRARYDREAASLMSYYKFQIDCRTLAASQFACLINQASKEIRAKLAAYKR